MFIIGFLNNFFSSVSRADRRKIPMKHQIFLWFCGLRGAVSFALAVEVLGMRSVFPQDIRALIFGTTMIVVIVTVMFMGGLTPVVLKLLKLDGKSKPDVEESEEVQKTKRTSLTTLDEYMTSPNGETAAEAAEFMDAMNNGFWMKLYEVDKRFIKPIFSGVNRRSRRSQGMFEMQNVRRGSSVNRSNSIGDRTYEFTNNNAVSALEDSDDEDELDRVPIAVAAEMVIIF